MNSRKRPTYWQRLKAHPGTGIATAFTIMGAFVSATARDAEGLTGWQLVEASVIGALVMGVVVWAPVLITARNQPVSLYDEDS